MKIRGTFWANLGLVLLLTLLGCRSTQPDLKPPVQKEVLNSPPDDMRYNSPSYPKQAMVSDGDPTKKWAGTGAMPPPGGMGGGSQRGGAMNPAMGGGGGMNPAGFGR